MKAHQDCVTTRLKYVLVFCYLKTLLHICTVTRQKVVLTQKFRGLRCWQPIFAKLSVGQKCGFLIRHICWHWFHALHSMQKELENVALLWKMTLQKWHYSLGLDYCLQNSWMKLSLFIIKFPGIVLFAWLFLLPALKWESQAGVPLGLTIYTQETWKRLSLRVKVVI